MKRYIKCNDDSVQPLQQATGTKLVMTSELIKKADLASVLPYISIGYNFTRGYQLANGCKQNLVFTADEDDNTNRSGGYRIVRTLVKDYGEDDYEQVRAKAQQKNAMLVYRYAKFVPVFVARDKPNLGTMYYVDAWTHNGGACADPLLVDFILDIAKQVGANTLLFSKSSRKYLGKVV